MEDKIIKYYVCRIYYRDLEYLKDDEGRILEFDTEKEVREVLQEYKNRNLKGMLCWKREEI